MFARRLCMCVVCLVPFASVIPAGAAPVHDAAKAGNVEEIRRILAKDPGQANAQNEWGGTPLWMAVQANRMDAVELLLRNGARVSIKDYKLRRNALDCADRCLFECTDEFHKLEMHALKWEGKSSRALAEQEEWLKKDRGEEARQKFLKIRAVLAEVLEREEAADQKSPLFAAVLSGNADETKRLLEKGFNTEVKDKEGRTPLLLAVMHGHVAIVKILLDHGAIADERDKRGQSAYSAARQMRDVFETTLRDQKRKYIEEEFRKGGFDINAKDNNGETGLMRAAAAGDLEDVKWLLRLGARTDVKNNKGQSLADVACTRTCPPQTKALILKCVAEEKGKPAPEKPDK